MAAPDRHCDRARGSGRPAVDPEEAFSFYASLSPPERSYRAVAERFGISARTVERYGREGGWRERLQAIELFAHAELDQTLSLERARQLADVKKLIDASFVSYARQLASGDVRFTPGGFVSVVKLLLERLDAPDPSSPAGAAPVVAERSFEHKLEVLRALREAGAFEALDRVLAADQELDDDGSDQREVA